MNALEYRNVTKQYNGFKLDSLNLKVPSGSIVGFIGENGAGKTTAMKLALGLIQPDSGELLLLGQNIKDPGAKQLKEHVGVVLEEASYPDIMNIKQIENIVRHIYKTFNPEKFAALKKFFSLPDKKEIKDFSRGMKMKLSLCVALSHDSQLLILDEATSGLDPIARDQLLDLFLEFLQEEDHSIFVSSHIISDLEKICDYIAFIHKGKLMFCEEKDVLLNQYAVLRCSRKEYDANAAHYAIGTRENSFGIEALIKREHYRGSCSLDKASIEDIMIFYTKGAGIC